MTKKTAPLSVISRRAHNKDRWQWSVKGRQHLDLDLIAQDLGGILWHFYIPANTIPTTTNVVSIDSHPTTTRGWLSDYLMAYQSPFILFDEIPAGHNHSYAMD
jgi:hypothetical protein